MAEDWLADVLKYEPEADHGVVAAIVRYCGIALRTRDASLVSFSDSKETGRVRENFLRKKLALTDDDATLDAAIAEIGERMKADRTKNRVTVYYLLADRFDRLTLFGGTARGASVSAAPVAAAAAAAPLAAMSTAAAPEPVASAPPPPAPTPTRPVAGDPAGPARHALPGDGDDIYGFGCLAAALAIGLFLFAAIVGGLLVRGGEPAAPTVPPADFSANAALAPAAPAATAAAQPVPDGAGVIAAERDARPMLSVYFDSGKADVTPDFAGSAAPLIAYLDSHPDARVAISGYNDPTGNAALNAELSKNRAQNVQAALVAAGVDEARTDLVKPEDTTTTDLTPEEARRVEATVVGG